MRPVKASASARPPRDSTPAVTDETTPAPVRKKPKRSRRPLGLFTKRRFATFWLPVALIAGASAIAFNWSTLRTETLTRAEAMRTAVVDHPEFAVTDIEIGGHIQLSVHEIGDIVGIPPGTTAISSLRFDARRARAALLENPWIERASVAIDPSGIMKIEISERIPVAIWRNDAGFFLIDKTGHPIVPVATAAERLDLPLLIGPESNTAVTDARALLQGAPVTVLPKIAAMIRRGGRRWDVVTDTGLVLKLPAENPLDALRLFDDRRLEERLASSAVIGIDLRLPDDPPVIRLEPGASDMRDELLKTLRTTYR